MRYLLCLAVLLTAGCATNIGRAMSTAFSGTPEEVAASVKFVHTNMTAELKQKYEAVESAPVTNPDGSVNRMAAENRFRDMADLNILIERWEQLSESLADYLGVDLDKPDNASIVEADKRRKAFWSAILKSSKELVE